ncbi:hypothetical protein [Oenococcus sicerae]|uniref:hypothetical protein n=1 Tax=Oenococcus sicerae TaxID=2203724 RepID=UPI0039E861EA
MTIKEKIGSLYVVNKNTEKVTFILSFDKLPANYKIPIALGLFGLKKNEIYNMTLTIFYDNKEIINDNSIVIDANNLEIRKNNTFTDGIIGSTFDLSSPIINFISGMYTIKMELFKSGSSQPLDTAKTYVYAKQD